MNVNHQLRLRITQKIFKDETVLNICHFGSSKSFDFWQIVRSEI